MISRLRRKISERRTRRSAPKDVLHAHAAVRQPKRPAPSPALTASNKPLTIMTYNIHHGRGTDRHYSLDRIASVVKSCKPDIVALQEIEQYRERTLRVNQPEYLAKSLGFEHFAFARVLQHHRDDNHRHAAYGNAILSRFPIVAQEHFNITYTDRHEPRGCLHATVEVAGAPLHVFCVHLGLNYREREFQVERLLSNDIVNNGKFGAGPKILLGDFNNWWPVKSAKLVNEHFHNACYVTGRKRLRTFGKPFNVLCLDYIFTSRDVQVMSCEVRKDRLALVASDHRPLVCSVVLPGGQI